MAGANRKKARKPKQSQNQHGGGGKLRGSDRLSDVQKVLMSKGIFQSRKPLTGRD